MKLLDIVVKILFALFFIPAIAVHVLGPMHLIPSNEPLPSHIVHIICYSICFYTFLRPTKYRLALYALASIYPFAYHANCFFSHLLQQNKFTPVCLLVIVMLPLGAAWIKWRK